MKAVPGEQAVELAVQQVIVSMGALNRNGVVAPHVRSDAATTTEARTMPGQVSAMSYAAAANTWLPRQLFNMVCQS